VGITSREDLSINKRRKEKKEIGFSILGGAGMIPLNTMYYNTNSVADRSAIIQCWPIDRPTYHKSTHPKGPRARFANRKLVSVNRLLHSFRIARYTAEYDWL